MTMFEFGYHFLLCTNPIFKNALKSFQDFRQLLDESSGIFVKMKDFLVGWVQKGFQDFFRSLEAHFLVLSGKTSSSNETEGKSSEKIHAGLILVLAQLCVFIEQKVIPRITEVTNKS